MTNLSTKTVRFIDNGLFISFARKVAPSFKKVQYYIPWQTYAARSEQLTVGDGFTDVERIKFPLQNPDEVDLWVFTDLYHCDMQVFLADRGARVFGARMGEEMELYRWEFKQFLKKIGLPVQHCERFRGVDPLRQYLEKNKNKYIKTSFVRGDFETFRHDDIKMTEPRLDEIIHRLGPLKKSYEFIVEDEIPDAVEVGYDGFTIDGKFPGHAMMAYEVKDVGMIGTVKKYKDLAPPVIQVNKALSNALLRDNYRGFLSTEIRYGKERKPYLIDPCCRLGSPSNELLQELFDGWASVLWHGAEGVLVDPVLKRDAEFGVLAVIHSEFAVENWQPIYYPKEIERFVKLRFACRMDGVDYTVPQPVGCPQPGCVLGVGKSLIEAVQQCKSNASQVKGYGVDVSLGSIEDALDTIKEGEKVGIKFTDKPLPTKEQLARV